jgi:hypothetical protein
VTSSGVKFIFILVPSFEKIDQIFLKPPIRHFNSSEIKPKVLRRFRLSSLTFFLLAKHYMGGFAIPDAIGQRVGRLSIEQLVASIIRYPPLGDPS